MLTGDALHIWGDDQVRHRALEAIIIAWEQGDEAALREALRRVDDAVVAGLRVLGLPRGPVAAVRYEMMGRGWQGRKLPDCDLVFDAGVCWQAVRHLGISDDVFCTWAHESLHARQPFTSAYQAESRVARGYEEGLVEGLTRLVIGDRAGITMRERPYTWYMVAYETLAEVLGVPAERLWRDLWTFPPGDVRRAFPAVVEQERGALVHGQHQALRLRADTVFATPRVDEQDVDRETLRRAWRRVLP